MLVSAKFPFSTLYCLTLVAAACFIRWLALTYQSLRWFLYVILYFQVNAALVAALQKGTSFGAPCALENVLAQMVIDAVPSIEMVRFVNSGTEACMGMLRLARAFTNREKIIKFDGCYHGHADSFLVQVTAMCRRLP